MKAAVREAATNLALSEADFAVFRAFAEEVDRASYTMSSPDPNVYLTHETVAAYGAALRALNELCGSNPEA